MAEHPSEAPTGIRVSVSSVSPLTTDGVASGASQYLRVLDVTDVRNVFLVNTGRITQDPTALVGQLQWSPPSVSTAKTQGPVRSDLDPPRPESHYCVLMRAPGSSGAEVPLLLETTNDSGTLAPHAGAGLSPTLAASPGTVSSLGRSGLSHAAPVPRLLARRLSDDPSSARFNVYLAGPFALTHQVLTTGEQAALGTVSGKPRLVLFSAAGLRASVDPSLTGSDNPLFAFKSQMASGESRPRPGSAVTARTFDVHRGYGFIESMVREKAVSDAFAIMGITRGSGFQ